MQTAIRTTPILSNTKHAKQFAGHRSHQSFGDLRIAVSPANSTIIDESPQIAVIALGGNALLKRGEPLTMEAQMVNTEDAAASIRRLIHTSPELRGLCITHGNGPQVGLLAQQQTNPETALDILDAESEGQIGYMLEMALENAIPDKPIVTILTQIVVDLDDPAFQHPTKPIGGWFSTAEAEKLSKEKGWTMDRQEGDSWRRVVPSPQPRRIIESKAINTLLLHAGHIVICCGGGGIPVAEDEKTKRRFGVEAVIDKDAASALLAASLGAKYLIMLTDADAVYDPRSWPDKTEALPSPIKVSEVERMQKWFASGSMAPKVEAACWFVKKMEGGGIAGIGNIDDLVDIIAGKKGTLITNS